jgi:hypothetical protein
MGGQLMAHSSVHGSFNYCNLGRQWHSCNELLADWRWQDGTSVAGKGLHCVEFTDGEEVTGKSSLGTDPRS